MTHEPNRTPPPVALQPIPPQKDEVGEPDQLGHKQHLRDLTDEEVREYELTVSTVLVNHPAKIMCCLFVLFIIMTILSFGVIKFKLSDTAFEDKTDYRTKRMEAANDLRGNQIADQPPGKKSTLQPNAPSQLLRSEALSSFSFVYEADGNVMTLERMKFIKVTEDRLFAHPDYSKFCLLGWWEKDDLCPGAACPWYRTTWDYTYDYRLPDGARGVCSLPLQSISWWMWNTRVVDPVTKVPCDVENNFDACIATGILSMLPHVNDGKTAAEKQNLVEAGGVEPTQRGIDAFVRVSYRMSTIPEYSYLKYFYDKNFGDPKRPDSDPKKWHSSFVRSQLLFGGPIEKVDPVNAPGLVCHARNSSSDCETSIACEWVPYAGLAKGFTNNVTGCAVKQEGTVSSVYKNEGNTDLQDEWGSRFAKAITDDIDDVDGPVDVLYMADGTLFDKFTDVIIRDSLLAMIAFFFVYLYLQIHTGSFMLASLGMLQVIMPFPIAYFIYQAIFQVKGFYGLSTLTLFIVLAIGADDIFVFMDHWVQANVQPRHDTCTYMAGRFAHAWKASGKAMGITSVTTMCAFVATMSTPLYEVKYFGLFAAILVFLDYMLVMTFFACSVVVYHRYSEYTLGCCCCGAQALGSWFNCCTCYTDMVEGDEEVHPGCMQSKLAQPRTYETLEEAREALGPQLDFTPQPHHIDKPNRDDEKEVLGTDKPYIMRNRVGFVSLALGIVLFIIGFVALSQSRSTEMKTFMSWIVLVMIGLLLFCAAMNAFRAARDRQLQLGLAMAQENIFTRHIAPFLSGTKGPGMKLYYRFLPAFLLCGMWSFMVYEASTLQKTTKTEQWLPDWHPIQRYIDATFTEFPQSDQEFAHSVVVMIGVDSGNPVDRSNWDEWDAESIGTARLYESTTKYADYSSENFQLFVKGLCVETLAASKAGKFLQRTNIFNPPELDQNCFMTGFESHVTDVLKRSFPVPQSEYVSLLWNYTETQRAAMENADGMRPSDIHYDKILYKFNNPELPPVGVEAMVVSFNTTLKRFGNSNSDIRDWHDEWGAWISDIENGNAIWVNAIYGATGYPLRGQLMHASEIFIWMHTQDVLVKGAITGTLISLSLAGFVVFLGTLNLLIALLVVLELVGVVGYVLGVISLIGWEMGTIESVAVTILVGLSVDYVVHFAIHYKECEVEVDEEGTEGPTERQKRVFETVIEMGPTVLGGAATSIGAALVLLLTWVQFFYKFGICFLFTILFSYVWSMFFFLPLLSLIGPQNEFLSIRPLLAKCLPKFFATPEELRNRNNATDAAEEMAERPTDRAT